MRGTGLALVTIVILTAFGQRSYGLGLRCEIAEVGPIKHFPVATSISFDPERRQVQVDGYYYDDHTDYSHLFENADRGNGCRDFATVADSGPKPGSGYWSVSATRQCEQPFFSTQWQIFRSSTHAEATLFQRDARLEDIRLAKFRCTPQ